MAQDDPFNLQRFVAAQNPTYADALRELEAGRKRTHWMWYVFPQVSGLGSSPMAQEYAISGLEEARAYLQHPELGQRLKICTAAVLTHKGRSALDIFGSPDDVKFRSSMTLFRRADPDAVEFDLALTAYFDGAEDPKTLEKLA